MEQYWIIHLRPVAVAHGQLELQPYTLGPLSRKQVNWQVAKLQVEGYKVIGVYCRTERLA